jgi:hypothetical protein
MKMKVEEFGKVIHESVRKFEAHWNEALSEGIDHYPSEFDSNEEWLEQFESFLEMEGILWK